MRLRGRILFKVFFLILLLLIILIITLSYTSNNNKQDAFLTHLPPLKEEVFQQQEAVQQQHVRSLIVERNELNTNKLLNLTDFQFTISNDICQKYDKELLGIIIITSYVGHDELRAAHRQAIAQSKLAEMGFQRVFLLAEIPAREKFITQSQLLNEQGKFNDLLQGNFQEAYRNLSFKHVMGLRWAAINCARAKFIVKLDDDIVYDVFQLRHYLESLELKKNELTSSDKLLIGYSIKNNRAIRNKANKWFVSAQEYGGNVYPAYLSGWMYITNAATAMRLVREAQRTPYFWIDDLWVTGILRSRLNIPLQEINEWFSENSGFIQCCVRDLKQHNYECDYYVYPNGGDGKIIIEFLHNVEKCYFDECVKRTPDKSLNKTCVTEAKHIIPDHGDAQVRQIKLR